MQCDSSTLNSIPAIFWRKLLKIFIHISKVCTTRTLSDRQDFFLELGPILIETMYWQALQPIIRDGCRGQLTAQSQEKYLPSCFLKCRREIPFYILRRGFQIAPIEKLSCWDFALSLARTGGILNGQTHSMGFTTFLLLDGTS